MSAKSEDYRRHQHEFTARAIHCTQEIAMLWLQVAASYRFLADREDRIEAEQRVPRVLPTIVQAR